MSRLLIPRPSPGDSEVTSPTSSHKPRKISTACGACKQRKTRCSGKSPCEACGQRGSHCIYDVASDQRRKIANQRNIQELNDTQLILHRHRQLLGGIIATLRAGDQDSVSHLLSSIQSGMDLSQLAAHVRNTCRANPKIDEAFSAIYFVIDGGEDLPSPKQLMDSLMNGQSRRYSSDGSGGSGSGETLPPLAPFPYQMSGSGSTSPS